MHTIYSFIYEHSAGWLRRWKAESLVNSKVFIVRPIIRDIRADSSSASNSSGLRCGNRNGGLCNIFTQDICWQSWSCALGPAQHLLSSPFLEEYLWIHGEPFLGQSLAWASNGVWLYADQLVLSCPVPKVFWTVCHPRFPGWRLEFRLMLSKRMRFVQSHLFIEQKRSWSIYICKGNSQIALTVQSQRCFW